MDFVSDSFAGEKFSATTYVTEMFLSTSLLAVSSNINHLEADGELLGDGRTGRMERKV